MRIAAVTFAAGLACMVLGASQGMAGKQSHEFQTGRWSGGPYAEPGQPFSHCFMSADDESGIRLLFIQTRSRDFQLVFIRTGWGLTIGENYPVTYWIDRYTPRKEYAVARSESTAALDLEDTAALFEEMRRGYKLYVRAETANFIFDLKDTYRALKDLEKCVDVALQDQSGHEEGLAAWQKGDFRTAINIFRPLAEHGNADSQFSLGYMYYKGQGVPKDMQVAVKWMLKAADQNYGDAQYMLGVFYTIGEGFTVDLVLAANWFRVAANQGHASAQIALGGAYLKGTGVRQDVSEALKLYQMAADQGNADALNSLSVIYSKGLGVPVDHFRAYFWATLAASKGFANAVIGRDKAAEFLTPDQIKEAQELAANWKPGSGQTGVSRTAGSTTERPVQQTARIHPDDIAVIIGNADYGNRGQDIPDVAPAVNDAKAVKQFFTRALGVKEGNIIYIENATGSQIVSVFGNERSHKGKLFNWVKPNRSRVYVYYAGHGAPGKKDGSALLVPTDATSDTIDLTGYPLETLYRNLDRLPAKSVTLILEACFSGLTQAGWLSAKASGISVVHRPPEIPGNLTVISAAASDQIASWKQDESNSLFTSYFLRGMTGEADNRPYGNQDGKVSYPELATYLEDTLTYDARRIYGRDQKAQIVVGRGQVR